MIGYRFSNGCTHLRYLNIIKIMVKHLLIKHISLRNITCILTVVNVTPNFHFTQTQNSFSRHLNADISTNHVGFTVETLISVVIVLVSKF